MEKWLDLLTPSAAALSLLLGLALLVQTIRHGRLVRRLESRLAEREGAAARVSLDRLTQLQRRATTPIPSGTPTPGEKPVRARPKNLGAIAAVSGMVVLVGATAWYVFLRDTTRDGAERSTTTTSSTPRPTPPTPGGEDIPESPKPLEQSNSFYTILVLNGTTTIGLAGQGITPLIQAEGYRTAPSGNVSGERNVKESYVMYIQGKQDVADNVGKLLRIKKKRSVDGIDVTTQDLSNVDAIVVAGADLARQYAP